MLIPIYTRVLTPSDYGIINSMDVLSSILFIIFTLGINRSVPRLFFDFKTHTSQRTFIGSINIFLFASASIMLFVTFIFKDQISLIFSSIDFFPYFALAIITSYLSVFSQVPMALLRITEKVKSFIGISFGQFLIGTIFTLVLVVFLKRGAI